MTTAAQLATSVLRKIRVLGAGETADADDAELVRERLNDLLESWSAEELMIYDLTQVSRALTVGTQSFTIGPTGDVVGGRPIAVIGGYVRAGTSDTPIDVKSRQQYNALSDKTNGYSAPSAVFYEPTLPDGRVWLMPVCGVACTIYLDVQRVFTNFADLVTDVSLPPAYKRAIELNLAVDVAPDFGKVVPPETQRSALGAKSQLKIMNLNVPTVNSEAVFISRPSRFDVMSG